MHTTRQFKRQKNNRIYFWDMLIPEDRILPIRKLHVISHRLSFLGELGSDGYVYDTDLSNRVTSKVLSLVKERIEEARIIIDNIVYEVEIYYRISKR